MSKIQFAVFCSEKSGRIISLGDPFSCFSISAVNFEFSTLLRVTLLFMWRLCLLVVGLFRPIFKFFWIVSESCASFCINGSFSKMSMLTKSELNYWMACLKICDFSKVVTSISTEFRDSVFLVQFITSSIFDFKIKIWCVFDECVFFYSKVTICVLEFWSRYFLIPIFIVFNVVLFLYIFVCTSECVFETLIKYALHRLHTYKKEILTLYQFSPSSFFFWFWVSLTIFFMYFCSLKKVLKRSST